MFHVIAGDDVDVAGAGDIDISDGQGVLHGADFIAFHGGLQGADGVDLGDEHAGAEAAHGLGAALAHIAVTADHDDLAGNHDVSGTLDAVGQGLAAAVKVVEFGLGHGVIDVDGREKQFFGGFELIQPVDAGGGFLGNAADMGGYVVPVVGILCVAVLQAGQDDGLFLAGSGLVEQGGIILAVAALVNEQGGVTAIVHDEVRSFAIRPGLRHFGAPPVVLEAFTLPREDFGHPVGGDGRGGVILGGEDVAGSPADVGTELIKRPDEHGRLDGHMQGTGDAQSLKRLARAVLSDAFHEAGHLTLGKLHFLASEVCEIQILYFVIQGKVEFLDHVQGPPLKKMRRLVTRLVINHYMRITEYSFPQSLSSTSPEGKISRKQKKPGRAESFPPEIRRKGPAEPGREK